MKNYGKLEMAKPAFWLGIVEATGDINSAGRYKVRIFGYHTADKSKLPTKDLPYAVPINPVTSASMNGIMDTPALVQGSTVFGCFLDGEIGQTPVILGSIAGEPAEQDFQDGQGFSDPAKVFPRAASGTAAQSNNEEGIIDGAIGAVTDAVTDAVSGAISSLTGGLLDGEDANDADVGTGFSGVGEPDISRLARGQAAETHYSLVNRRKKIADINAEGVPTAKAPFTEKSAEALLVACSTNGDTETKPWKLPDARATEQGETTSPQTYFDPKSGGSPTGEETSLYPFNQVKETISGIVKEYDNTPGNIRISEFHPANTWYEIHNDGSKTTYVSGSDNVVIEGDSNVYIKGNANLTVGKNMKQKVKGDYYLEVEGNMYHTVHGERHVSIGQSKGEKGQVPPGNDVYATKGSQHKEINGSQSHNIGGQLYNVVAGVPPGTKKPETFGVFFNVTNGIGMATEIGDANKGFTLSTGGGPFTIKSTGFNVESLNNIKLKARDNFQIMQNEPASKDGEANEFTVITRAPAKFTHDDTHTTTVKKEIALTGDLTRVDIIKGQDTLKIDNLDIMKHDDTAVDIDVTGNMNLTGTVDAEVEVKAGDPEVTLTGHVHPQTGGTGGDGDSGVDTGTGVG